MCLTQHDENRLSFPMPDVYNPERYTLLARYLATGVWDVLQLTTWMPNGKTDTNNFGGFSTDNIGMNHGWPRGSYEAREAIFQDHVHYGQGLFWFLCHDDRVPESVRREVLTWGLPRDEFGESGGWPPELYIREARRMVSDYVMTEHNCMGRLRAEESVGLAAYGMDSHHCRRVVRAGRAFNEGDVQIAGFAPYPIAYASLIPKETECTNLIVPFCLSASHIAFGSIRMEPVFMVLGQSAATAAHQSISEGAPVQRISYAALRRQLLKDGQVLEWKRWKRKTKRKTGQSYNLHIDIPTLCILLFSPCPANPDWNFPARSITSSAGVIIASHSLRAAPGRLSKRLFSKPATNAAGDFMPM